MRRVHEILCLCVFFTIAHASFTAFPGSCQSAELITGLTFSVNRMFGSGYTGALTSQCSELVSAATEAWFKYVPLVPEEISASACFLFDTDDAFTIAVETTGYSDCVPRNGICTNDYSEFFNPGPGTCSNVEPSLAAKITNTLLIPQLPYYIRLNAENNRASVSLTVEQVRTRPELVPANDECGNSMSFSFPFSHSGTTMYSSPSSFSCREDLSIALGDVFYSFSSNTNLKEFVACATWGIQLSVIDASFTPLCPGRTPGTVSCAARASKGADNCARITSNLAAGYVVVSGDTPLSRGSYTFNANFVSKPPVIICPPDLVRSASVCSGPAYYGSTGVPTLISISQNPLRFSKTPKAPYNVGRNLITFTVYDDIDGSSSSCVQVLTINPPSTCQ